jgi:hypothetical protein
VTNVADITAMQLGGATSVVGNLLPWQVQKVVEHLLHCHEHHFAVINEQRSVACSPMAVQCLIDSHLTFIRAALGIPEIKMTQQPRLLRRGLSGAVFVATKYEADEQGNPTVVHEKYDVTHDYDALVATGQSAEAPS